jgi:pimeloyl-ACP methyl ester carboxylesterase
MTTAQPKTGYAPVNGLPMYYEVHGSGRPLVLLHGGISNIETDFGLVLPGLAKERQVIAIEQQAHGHTGDIDRPLSIAQMADDIVALLRQIGVENADFFGYSMGGAIALQIGIEHPEMVGKLVLAAVGYKRREPTPGQWIEWRTSILT